MSHLDTLFLETPNWNRGSMAQDFTLQDVARRLGRNPATEFERRKPVYRQAVSAARFENDLAPESERKDTSAAGNGSIVRLVMIAIALLLVVSLLMLALAHFVGNEIAQGGHTFNTKPVEIVMENNVLQVPANLIRFSYQRHGGNHEKLDLYLHWPDLDGYNETLARDFNDLEDMSRIIFLTLEPRTMAYDMSGRIKPIYERYFVGPQEAIGHGLVRRKLSEDAGFVDEYLVFEKDSPYPFTARCLKEGVQVGASMCIRDIQIGDNLSLTYRFHARYLKDWLRLDESIRNRIQQLLVSG